MKASKEASFFNVYSLEFSKYVNRILLSSIVNRIFLLGSSYLVTPLPPLIILRRFLRVRFLLDFDFTLDFVRFIYYICVKKYVVDLPE